MYTVSSIILKLYLLQTIFFYKNSKFKIMLFFCFRQDRPTGPVDRRLWQGVHVCACPSADRPGRPTVSRFALGFSGSTARSTARRKLCFYLEDGRPGGRPELNGSLPTRQTVDRTGRPPGLQSANGSFLFGAILNLFSFSVL